MADPRHRFTLPHTEAGLAVAREHFREEARIARHAGDFERWRKAILGYQWAKDDARKELRA